MYIRAIAKRLALFLGVIICACSLAGCGDSKKTDSFAEKKKEEKIQIGMCFDSFVIERWQRDRDVFVSMAKELGAEVNVQNANGDAEVQKKQIDYFIKKDMDVIVVICIDSDTIKDSVSRARDEGIKVIAYDRLIKGVDVDLYISFDNEKVGEMMATSMVDKGLPDKKVLMICGSLSDNNVAIVEKGFTKVMEENNIEIIDKVYAEGWRAEAAGEYIYENMDKVMKVDGIMCGNDDLASRVIYALAEKRLAGKKIVVGQDADLEACQKIVEGTQLMTVYKPIEKLAGKAAECAVILAKGEEIDDTDLSEFEDDNRKIAFLKIDPVSVTAQNMDDVIIKSGFHLQEDVYLNVNRK